LKDLGLYVIPQKKGEWNHPKGEDDFDPLYDIKPFKRIPNVRSFSVKVQAYD